jgi:hypothetical protein
MVEQSKVVLVEAYCEGKKPYLMNPATEALLESLRTGIHPPLVKDRSREDVARDKIYREEGQIGIPAGNLFACLVEAGRQVDLKSRVKISTKESTQLPSFFELEDLFLPYKIEGDEDYNPEKEWKADMRRGKLPKDGTMVAIVRPRFDRWGFKVRFTIDTSIINVAKVRTLFDLAGRSVGLGDFRPSCRGPFGTFAVKRWTVLKGKEVLETMEVVTDLAETSVDGKKAVVAL